MNSAGAPWEDWQTEKLIEMVPLGRSASQIGSAVHKSRNSVVSKCHRLGLQLTGSHPRAGAGKAARRPAKPRVVRIQFKPRLSPTQPEVKPMPVEPLYIALEDLRDGLHECREVVTPDGVLASFCGHPTKPGSSYCPFHSSVNEVIAPPRKEGPSLFRFGGRAA